jgi:hypothetical protein
VIRKCDVRVYDAVLGTSVLGGVTDTCSKCGHTIPDEHVPLMLWSDHGDMMWVYCEGCEGAMWQRVSTGKRP